MPGLSRLSNGGEAIIELIEFDSQPFRGSTAQMHAPDPGGRAVMPTPIRTDYPAHPGHCLNFEKVRRTMLERMGHHPFA